MGTKNGSYIFEIVKKTLIFAVVLSLIGLGPMPLSACALVSSRLAECATPATMSHCNHMEMGHGFGTAASAAPDNSCCKLSNAPAPTRQQKLADAASFTPSFIQILNVMPEPVPIIPSRHFNTEISPSPPPLHLLLCTFLI